MKYLKYFQSTLLILISTITFANEIDHSIAFEQARLKRSFKETKKPGTNKLMFRDQLFQEYKSCPGYVGSQAALGEGSVLETFLQESKAIQLKSTYEAHNSDKNIRWKSEFHFSLKDHLDLPKIGSGAHKVALDYYKEEGAHYVVLTPVDHKEIKIHKSLSGHPLILKLVSLDEESNSIVTEYCPSSLEREMKGIQGDPKTKMKYMSQLIEGLSYIHSKGIRHNDIKDANILIGEDRNIRIADFGVSSIAENEKAIEQYIQELIREYPENSSDNQGILEYSEGVSYNEKIRYLAKNRKSRDESVQRRDIYDLGELFLLMEGAYPKPKFSHRPSLEELRQVQFARISELGVSEEKKAVLRKMIDPDPLNRITIQELRKSSVFQE